MDLQNFELITSHLQYQHPIKQYWRTITEVFESTRWPTLEQMQCGCRGPSSPDGESKFIKWSKFKAKNTRDRQDHEQNCMKIILQHHRFWSSQTKWWVFLKTKLRFLPQVRDYTPPSCLPRTYQTCCSNGVRIQPALSSWIHQPELLSLKDHPCKPFQAKLAAVC